MRYLLLLALLAQGAIADVKNPVAFIGQAVLGSTPGAPLSADSNSQLISGITFAEVNATATTTTSSGTDAVMNSMTLTPTLAGTYKFDFNTDISSPTGGAVLTISYYVAGVQDGNTQRKAQIFAGGTLTSGSQRAIVSLTKFLTITAGQTVDVRWSTSAGTLTAAGRTFSYWRVQ